MDGSVSKWLGSAPSAIIMLGVLSPLGAQVPDASPSPLRSGYRIDAVRVATLSDSDGRAGLAAPLVVHRMRDGRFLVVPVTDQGTLSLFDQNGSFLRHVGRPGQGPGEYTAVLDIRPMEEGTVGILDPGNGRLTVLEEESLRVLELWRLPLLAGQFGALPGGDHVVLLAGLGSPERLNIVDRSGALVRTFVPTQGLGLRMAVSPAGTIALAEKDRYAIDIWSPSGARLTTWSHDPAWWDVPDQPGDLSQPPASYLGAPQFDKEGRLWTVASTPDESWSAVLEPGPWWLPPPALAVGEGRMNSYVDSVVEVLDIESGTVLASLRLDPALSLIPGDGLATSYYEDEVGLPYIDIWELRLLP